MTVQIATCSAAQLFSGCLLPGHSGASDTFVSSDGATVAGELYVTDVDQLISTLALLGWLPGYDATTIGRYTIRRGAWLAKPMS